MSFEMEAIGVIVKIVEPGARTDFAGRSFDFNNDEGMAEYQDIVAKLLAALGPVLERGSEPEVVAEVHL